MQHFRFLVLTAISFLLTAYTVKAQNAEAILDKSSLKLKNSGGISASFSATIFNKKHAESNTTGNIDILGNKVKLQSAAGTTWYDGKTRWVLQNSNSEVYISSPTTEEKQMLNPYSFMNMYKTGYSLSSKAVTYSGQSAFEVSLKAKSKKQEIQVLLVTISQLNSMPLCIRFRQSSGKWIRIQINNISAKHNWPASHFTFNEKDHPRLEIVDLR